MEGVHQVFNPKKSRFDELFEVEHLAVASQLPTIPIPTMFSQVSGGIPTEKDTCSFCSWASLLAHRLNRCLRILNLTGIFPHLGWEIPKFHMLLRTHLFTCFFCVSKCNDMGAANIQMDFSLSVEFTWSVVKVSVPCYNPHHAPSVNGFVCNLASDGTNKISTTAQFLGKGRRISANLVSSIQRKKKTKAVSGHLLSSPVVHLGLPDSEASLAYYDKLQRWGEIGWSICFKPPTPNKKNRGWWNFGMKLHEVNINMCYLTVKPDHLGSICLGIWEKHNGNLLWLFWVVK